MQIFLDSMDGGAWPFLVGGVICLVNSVNERDLSLLNSHANSSAPKRIRSAAGVPEGGGGSNLLSLPGFQPPSSFRPPSGGVRSGTS